MNLLRYIKRFLSKIMYWIVIIPLIVGLITLYYALRMPKTYKVRSEIYTGVISNPNPAAEESMNVNWNFLSNAMDNLMNVIKSPTTLKMVSMRLLAQHFVYGNPYKDTEYISADKYQELQEIIPKDIQALVDKKSEENTFNNFLAFQEATNINSFNTLLNSNMPYYSTMALSNIEASRIGISDMVELRYESDEPGIAFYSLIFLYQEFVKKYDQLRYDQLDNTIAFFEKEVKERRDSLIASEANLVTIQKSKGILNFELQAQSNIALSEALSNRHQEVLISYSRSIVAERELSAKIRNQAKSIESLQEFLAEKDAVIDISYKIIRIENLTVPSNATKWELSKLKKELSERKEKLMRISNKVNMEKYSQDGVSIVTILDQWVQESLNIKKTKAELEAIIERQDEINRENEQFLLDGFLLKQQGRDITTDEATYLVLINNLNTAKLKLKSLQLSGITMKEITPPNYPVEPVYSKRKATVLFSVVFSILFVIGYFFVRELLSRKMDNKFRVERLTSQTVLGAYPRTRKGISKKNKYILISNKYLSNKLLGFFKPEQQNIINLISINDTEGTAFMSEKIRESLEYSGLTIKNISYNNDYLAASKEYLLASDITDIYEGEEEIIIMELPPVSEFNVPEGLLNKASINILVVDSNQSWKDNYQSLLNRLIEKKGDAPFYIYLNKSTVDTLKEFTEIAYKKARQ